jgi:Secretion system C-terminal sorting domain/Cellulase (glycosyl hydrolase family 5)
MIRKIVLTIGLTTSFIIGYGQNNFNVLNSGTGYVRLEGKQFIDGSGTPFYPLLCNWEPQIVYDSPGNYHLSPYNSYGNNNSFECTNDVDCDQQILNEFNYIRSLGFNGVRINGFYPQYDFASGNFYLPAVDQVLQKQVMPLPIMTPPFINDANTNVLFDMYQKILDIASQVNSNNQGPFFVIINTCGLTNEYSSGSHIDYLTTMHPLYIQYLRELGKKLQGAPNLIAYDFWNEPCYSLKGVFSKEEVCNMVSDWVDNIKFYDQHHLTTVGNCWDDVIRFDAAVMKIDFMSPHFYPLNKIYDNQQTPIAEYLDQARGAFYWLGKNAPLPWIIGETGFTASSSAPLGWAPNETFGTLTEQKDYAEFITNLTRDCGGSGFSWWNFQDTHNNTDGSDTEGLNHWGLLERDIPCSNPLEPCPTQEKPLITNFFRTYGASIPAPNPANFTPPIKYLDPYNHSNLSTTQNFTLTGYISDQFGNPVEDAIVGGWNFTETVIDPNDPNQTIDQYYYHYTYSDANGYYQLIPYEYALPVTRGYIEHMNLSASSSQVFVVNNWGTGTPNSININQNLSQITTVNAVISRNCFGYDETVNNVNVTLASPAPINFKGWNTLTLNNVTIEGNGSIGARSDISARQQVQVNHVFHAAKGSEVHIYINHNLFAECNDYLGYRQPSSTATSSTTNSFNEKWIELAFTSSVTSLGFTVKPNPTSGLCVVEIFNIKKIEGILTLSESSGRKILSRQITTAIEELDLSFLSSGIYYLQLKTENMVLNKIIVLN